MKEFFIVTNSFAAPFCGDTSTTYVSAETPLDALVRCAREYRHPYGLYSASCYDSADSYHKGGKPLARWLCNHEIAKQEATRGKGGYSYRGFSNGFEIDGIPYTVHNPKDGRVVVG